MVKVRKRVRDVSVDAEGHEDVLENVRGGGVQQGGRAGQKSYGGVSYAAFVLSTGGGGIVLLAKHASSHKTIFLVFVFVSFRMRDCHWSVISGGTPGQ